MTALAVIVLVVWAIGIIAFAASVPTVRREQPFVDAAFVTDPARACLLMALASVFWPAVLMAAALARLVNGGGR